MHIFSSKVMNVLSHENNFLGINEEDLHTYFTSKCIIQQLPYEHTSSFKTGSKNGPHSIITNSKYVELYDIELNEETYKKCGIATLEKLDFEGKVDEEAINLIHGETANHLSNNKFIASLGAEHTVTYGIFKALQDKWADIGILQLDAHSDLRDSYEGN
ncbi:MAG: arginase family protein, partial [Bacteroidia bacterium]|nr:arginase family protein [Bacteroidia bacterium]